MQEREHDRIEMDTITCNAALSACEKSGEWLCVLGLLEKMARDRIEMDTITCSAAWSACGNAKEWLIALALSAKMGKQDWDGQYHVQCCMECL